MMMIFYNLLVALINSSHLSADTDLIQKNDAELTWNLVVF